MDEWVRVLDSTRVVDIFPAGMSAGSPLQTDAPIGVTEGRDVDALARLLRVSDVEDGMCMCLGDVTFRLRDAAGDTLATAALHHGRTLRWSGWTGDATLADGEGLVDWLAMVGVTGPAVDSATDRALRRREAEDRATWISAAPASALPLMNQLLETSRTGQIPRELLDLVGSRIESDTPDEFAQCAALLRWFGAGTGLVSGYPVHENTPHELIGERSMDDLIGSLYLDDRDATWIGAARHLAMWRSRSEVELRQVPPDVRHRLVETARRLGRLGLAEALTAVWLRLGR